ncbi:hypothetical protein LTR62_006864 [Meristemomyces frigidus]|uniref:N-acetyltransferase domain-containing protein n=1 Tax=Meristemomyces frigidus TaxID=1508187 RepID=A0AAN7YMP5_9PEZI|nr:hypothetical protein LTR62_006864 [Meristemomyces frigidus]
MAGHEHPSISLANIEGNNDCQRMKKHKKLIQTDVPEIHKMICELADYEKALHSVEATEDSLRNTLIFAGSSQNQSNRVAKTLILRIQTSEPQTKSYSPSDATSQIAGMALFYPTYSTWTSKCGIHLEDLYVRPAYRGRGYGKLLIQRLAEEVVNMGGARLEWQCLEWNASSLAFYDSLGARKMDGWVGLRLDGERLVEMATRGSEDGRGNVNGKVNGL